MQLQAFCDRSSMAAVHAIKVIQLQAHENTKLNHMPIHDISTLGESGVGVLNLMRFSYVTCVALFELSAMKHDVLLNEHHRPFHANTKDRRTCTS